MRNTILNLNQERIFSIFFELSEKDISWSTLDNNNKLNNPLRDDSDPSLSFKWYNNKLVSRDFGDSSYSGDVFKVVGYIINRNCFVNSQFIEICNIILDRYYKTPKSESDEYRVIRDSKNDDNTINSIIVTSRTLVRSDYNFYSQFGIDKNIVNHFVTGVLRYSIVDKHNKSRLTGYRNSPNDPCYHYKINDIFDKLYFPNRSNKSIYPRFLTTNKLQLDDITSIYECLDIIIIKSIKDKMLLLQFLDFLNISDICILTSASETVSFSNEIMSILLEYTKYNIYAMFDMDKAGIKSMDKLFKEYGIIPLYFDVQAKDPTDCVKDYGYNRALNNFKNVYNIIKNNRNDRLIKHR